MGKKNRSKAATKNKADVDGKMPKREVLRFYDLLTFLGEIAVPLLEANRKNLHTNNYVPLGWKYYDSDSHTQSQPTGMKSNSWELRMIVVSFILRSIDLLIDEISSKKYDVLFVSIFNRRLTKSDKEEIQSWKLHIRDDFFYVKTRPYEGAVFVQYGATKLATTLRESDAHQPRVFVVQGLVGTLSYDGFLKPEIDRFREENPAIIKEFPNATVCLFSITLIPYNGGITYMSLLGSAKEHHYQNPKALADAVRKSIRVSDTVFEACSQQSVVLYRSLNPETDYHICRQADHQSNIEVNELGTRYTLKAHEEPRNDSNTTKFTGVHQDYWKPYQAHDDVRTESILKQVINGPKPFIFEGMSISVVRTMLSNDENSCLFHNEMAFGKFSKWKDCCKSDFLRRKSKSERTNNAPLITIMNDPLKEEESKIVVDKVERLGGIDALDDPYFPLRYAQIGYLDCGTVRMKILTEYIPRLTEAFHNNKTLHSIQQHKWYYIGHCPFNFPAMGIMTFAELNISPLTGILEGTAKTANRLTAILIQMKKMCKEFDIPIIDATIEMQPLHKMKPDEKMLKYNQELLQKDLETIIVSQTIDKRANEGIRRQCVYCGVDRKEDGANLMKCACKLVYFCSVECQRSQWPNHKIECKATRERSRSRTLL